MVSIFDRFPVSSSSHLPLMFGLYCGMRLGEVFALTWNDIDLSEKKIIINKQIQWRQFDRTDEEKKTSNGMNTGNCKVWYFRQQNINQTELLKLIMNYIVCYALKKKNKKRLSSILQTDMHIIMKLIKEK